MQKEYIEEQKGKNIFPIWAVIEHFGPWNMQNGVEQRFSWLAFHINHFVGNCAQQTQLCHSEKDNGSEEQQQHFSKMTGGSGVSLDILWSCHTFRKHWSLILWNSGPLSQLRAKHIVMKAPSERHENIHLGSQHSGNFYHLSKKLWRFRFTVLIIDANNFQPKWRNNTLLWNRKKQKIRVILCNEKHFRECAEPITLL